MSKEREMYGIKILSNDEYNEYKGTYEEQIKDLKEEVEYLDEWRREYRERIDKAIEVIRKYGYEKQMEEDYLINRVNLANYNCLLLDILEGNYDKE